MLCIERIHWDTQFFGFAVGRIREDDGLVTLDRVCESFAASDLRMIYWAANSLRVEFALYHVVDQVLLRKRRFGANEQHLIEPEYRLEEHQVSTADEELVTLALEAGWSSRFCLDRRIEDRQFLSLYQTWIDRSCKREIADIVFVAKRQDEVVGLITASIGPVVCKIGLIAVANEHKREGIGRALLEAVEGKP